MSRSSRAVFFFQPLVWYAARQVSHLAECVCDRAVLDAEEDPTVYAELLTRIAFRLPDRALSTEMAAGILFTNSSFFRRVRDILSDRKSRLSRLSRRALAGVAVAAFFSLVVAAALPLNEKNGEMITLSGSVFRENLPVPGAKIYVYYPGVIAFPGVGEGDRAVEAGKTKRDGSFSVKIDRRNLKGSGMSLQTGKLPPSVVAYRPGYALGFQQIFATSDFAHTDIRIGGSETIKGMVRDRSGNPVEEARITIQGMYSMMGDVAPASILTCSAIPEMSAKTGGNGEFVLNGLPEGVQKVVKIEAKGFATRLELYAPEGNDGSTYTLEPEGFIEGRIVYGDTGKPAKDIPVQALMFENGKLALAKAATDKDGRFRIQALLPGKYFIALASEETPPDLVAAPVENIRVEPGKTIAGVELKLISGGVITGKVSDMETGAPIGDQLIRLRVADSGSILMVGSTSTDENGVYRLRSIPGKMWVVIQATGKYESASSSQQEVTVSDGRNVSGIDFQLKKGMFRLSGRVLSPEGAPVEGATVTANNRDSFSPIGAATTDSNGRFELFGPKEGAEVILKARQEGCSFRARSSWRSRRATKRKYGWKNTERRACGERFSTSRENPCGTRR